MPGPSGGFDSQRDRGDETAEVRPRRLAPPAMPGHHGVRPKDPHEPTAAERSAIVRRERAVRALEQAMRPTALAILRSLQDYRSRLRFVEATP